MKRIFSVLSGLAVLTGAATASAQPVYLKHIDLSTQVSPTSGITLAHVAIDESGSTPIAYVTTLNNSGAGGVNVPAIKIEDPLGATPVISILETNNGTGTGVDNARGYGGVAVDDSGNVFLAWTGNGANDSARIRKYSSAGALLNDWLYLDIASQRLGGIDVDPAGTAIVGARFLNTSTVQMSFYTGANGATLTHTAPTTANPGAAANPRDIAYDAASGKVYINANAIIEVFTPNAGGPLTTPANYSAANGGTGTILISATANSFAGHGVGVNADGSLIGHTPNPSAGVGARTIRISDSAGTLVHTLGTLDTKGDGTDGELGRASDIAFFDDEATLTVAVPDYDDNVTLASRTFTRLVIYQEPPASVSDWTMIQE